MLSGTDLSKPVREAIEDEKVSAYSTFHAIAEAEYILCRSKGRETARAKVESLIQSGTVELVEARSLVHDAALLKCERAIALTDAFTLALAEKIGGLAFFARPEDDLTREERRRPFATRLAFLEDFKRVKPKEAEAGEQPLKTRQLSLTDLQGEGWSLPIPGILPPLLSLRIPGRFFA